MEKIRLKRSVYSYIIKMLGVVFGIGLLILLANTFLFSYTNSPNEFAIIAVSLVIAMLTAFFYVFSKPVKELEFDEKHIYLLSPGNTVKQYNYSDIDKILFNVQRVRLRRTNLIAREYLVTHIVFKSKEAMEFDEEKYTNYREVVELLLKNAPPEAIGTRPVFHN